MSEHSAKLPKDGVIAGGLAQRLRDALAGCQPDTRRVRVEFVNDCAFEVDLTNTTPSETQQTNGATLQRLIERVLHAEAPESNCWPSCGCAYNGNDIVSVCDRHAPGMCFSVCAVCGDRHIRDEQRAALDSWMSSVQQAKDSVREKLWAYVSKCQSLSVAAPSSDERATLCAVARDLTEMLGE